MYGRNAQSINIYRVRNLFEGERARVLLSKMEIWL
jgi:hypothetical protein